MSPVALIPRVIPPDVASPPRTNVAEAPASPRGPEPALPRLRVGGKFLFAGDEKFYLRGVTYGPFAPDAAGDQYRTPQVVSTDFATMAAHGVNAVRLYTMPPRWVLDSAAE